MPTTFLTGSDWQSSSGPLINRNVHPDDLWPHLGTVAGKPALAAGIHMPFAIGLFTNNNALVVVGVSVSYDATSLRTVLNIAPGFMFKAWVANTLTYGAPSTPNTWGVNLAVGTPVYLDPSVVAGIQGTNLTLSPLDDAGHNNPRVGFVMPDQDEDVDTGIGGANADVFPKAFTDAISTHELLVTVMLWPDAW
jgi:hypothetical protein